MNSEGLQSKVSLHISLATPLVRGEHVLMKKADAGGPFRQAEITPFMSKGQ